MPSVRITRVQRSSERPRAAVFLHPPVILLSTRDDPPGGPSDPEPGGDTHVTLEIGEAAITLLSDIIKVLQGAEVSYTVQAAAHRLPGDPDLVITVSEQPTTASLPVDRQTADRQTADRQTADRQTADRRAADRLTASSLPLSSVMQVGSGVIHVWFGGLPRNEKVTR